MTSVCRIICGGLLLADLAGSPSPTVDAGDYTSIHDAVAALPESGGTVLIPAGKYEISEPIVVEKSDVTILGRGSGTILKNVSRTGADTFRLMGRPGQENRIWRVKIADLHLIGSQESGHAVYAYNVNELSLNDMWVDHHGKSGLYLDGCYENPRVFDNNIAYNRDYGIFLRGCHDIVVSGNQLEENGCGIYAVEVWNAGVTANSVDDHVKHSLYFKEVYGSIVSSNMFENSRRDCLVLDEGCNGITVTGNIMRYSGPVLLRVNATKGITIAGNTFESDEGSCIRMENGTELVTVSGNVLFGLRQDGVRGMEWGMILENAAEISISGNTIVKPFAGGIYASGSEQRHLTITGNTVKDASWKSPGKYAGIHLRNTYESVVQGNSIIEDTDQPCMKAAIEEAGDSDFNLLANNQVSVGTKGSILIQGENTEAYGNQSRARRGH